MVARAGTKAGSTRARLLDAAERHLLENGADSLTLEAVAAAAQASKGGLLYHFPTKDALVEALVQRAVDDVDAVLGTAAESTEPGAFARAFLDEGMPTVPRRGLMVQPDRLTAALVGAATIDPGFLEPLRNAYLRWQARLEHDGIDPVTATLVRLAVDGWWMASVLDLPPVSRELYAGLRDRLEAMTRA
jgi:AcrR family transcriptional regulator